MAAPRSTTRRRYLTNFDYRYNEHVTLRGLVAHPLCV